MLEVRALRAGYGAVEVLHEVSLNVSAGEIVALLGSNGAGKSTLNNTLSGLVRARSGSVHMDGVDITRAAPTDIIALGLIHVPEGRRVFPNLNVRENLELGSYRRGRARRQRNLEKVFEVFPRLHQRVTQSAGTLSGGEQQMLAIARAIATNPKVLMLDELSMGLAPLVVAELYDVVKRIAADRKSTRLNSSH